MLKTQQVSHLRISSTLPRFGHSVEILSRLTENISVTGGKTSGLSSLLIQKMYRYVLVILTSNGRKCMNDFDQVYV